jgi:HSP20 family protein
MVMRFDPFRELDRLTQPVRNEVSGFRAMPMDAYRRGEAFHVHFDLPGVDPDSIDVTVDKNVLNVKAERHWPREEGDEIVVHERPEGAFSRQLFLGDTLDPDGIQAEYDHGVLSLTIPVAERAKPRQVKIGAGASGSRQIDAESRSRD